MSKQLEAKQAQGYEQKPVIHVCKNSKHFTSKFTNAYDIWNSIYQIEKEMRCGIGGFAVKKMGTCNLYKA